MNTGNDAAKVPGLDPAKKKRVATFREITSVLKRPSLYAGALVLLLGILANFLSQAYLHEYTSNGRTLPALSDLLLDNLPYWDIDYMSDIFSVAALLVFGVYVFHRRRFARVPYYLLLCGIFQLVRALFIVLTPFGNPPMFDGTEGPFNGFSMFELGVYPSGHTGVNFLYLLFAADRYYRLALLACVVAVVAALFLSRAHYSIDVLSGVFFAYAIKSFGDKHLLGVMLPENASVSR